MQSHRLVTIDIARGLSVLIMVCVHTLWMYADKNTQTGSLLGSIIHLLGKGTASFLIAMGISLLLSRKQSSIALFYRGLIILAIGYTMNFLKFILPIVAGIMPESFIAAYGWQLPLTPQQFAYLLLTGDILQMAGFALLLLALITKLSKQHYTYLGLALLIALLAKPLSGWQPNMIGLDYFARVLFSNSYHIYFPLFPWLSCILLGMFLSKRYVIRGSETKLYSDCLYIGAGLTFVGATLLIWNFDYHFANFFHLGFGGIVYLCGMNLLGLWLLHNYITPLLPQYFIHALTYCSRHVTSLYVLQWVLICWGMAIVGYQTLSQLETLVMMPLCLFVTLSVHKCGVFLLKNTKRWITKKVSLVAS